MSEDKKDNQWDDSTVMEQSPTPSAFGTPNAPQNAKTLVGAPPIQFPTQEPQAPQMPAPEAPQMPVVPPPPATTAPVAPPMPAPTPAPASAQLQSLVPSTSAPVPSGDGNGEWIEEGLYYQGPQPPHSEDWHMNDWVEIPHEHYIPISKSRLLQALWTFPKARDAGIKMKHFVELVEGIYHFHYHQTLNELKEDYEYFSPDGGEDLRKGLPEEQIIWRERRFLGNFLKAMTRGNFNPFSKHDYDRALEQNYLFDLSVDINWDVHDETMLDGFIEANKQDGHILEEELELDESLEEFLDFSDEMDRNMLLFYRGIDRDQTSGLFLLQKVDIFLSRILSLFVWPVQWIIERLRGDKEKAGIPSIGDAVSLLSFGLLNVQQGDDESSDEAARTTIFERRWLRRQNLQNQNIKLKNFLETSKLQEPTLDRVVCLFRLRPPEPPQLLDPIINRFSGVKKIIYSMIGKQEGTERDWSIHMKMFKSIPLADIEMLMPEKNVRMKSFDVTMLFLTGFAGIFALYKGLQQEDKTIIFVIIGVLFAYLIKLVLGYRRVRANYMARMTKELYHKSLDNDFGVLQYLVDTLEEQEFKEASLAYFFLWNEGRPMTEDELDAKIESFLKENFDDIEIDFEVDDALDKVIEKEGPQPHKHIPIVEVIDNPGGETLYKAKPIEEALRIMDEKWDNFYDYNEG
ncbi:MAG: hypothetical protein CL920_26770 [Deltaproteobacteria bacterium]|nr:hypothetical protein [Deltaproteobacteria bacterium]